MNADTLLTEERRARMAAERLLAQKEAELNAANRMLSRHAIHLSEEVVEKREEVEAVRGDLDRANSEIDIAKRRLWNSIQSIEDGFAVFDADSRLVIANSAYLQPFDGLECIRPGAHYEEIVEAALAEGMVDIDGLNPGEWRETMLARWFSTAPEPRVIRLWDGTWIRLVDQRAPGGDTVCLGLNITDTKRREAALTRARERAEVANRAKTAFLANMSHEIRTPMSGVVGMADLLGESDLNNDQRLCVDTIRSSGQSLLTILNDVLDYSKIEAGKFTLRPEPFDLERVILDVMHLMGPTIRAKGLKVLLDYDMFLPTRFEGDPVRVRQVLTNLIGNAVKFTERGHVLLRVVGRPAQDSEPLQVHIVVEDTGIGIPADKVDHIFGEFNQVEDDRNRAYEGTGLGLSITRELITLMDGDIWVESTAGVGSAFGVRLPLTALDPIAPPHLPQWMRTALLVMDDDLSRTIFEKRLTALGLTVTSLAMAEAATPEIAARADVILADDRLSDMGSAAFLAVLRRLGATAPLVLIAAPREAAPHAAGVAAVISKPVSRPDLVATLSELEPPQPLLLSGPIVAPDPVGDMSMPGAAPPPRFTSLRSATPPPAPDAKVAQSDAIVADDPPPDPALRPMRVLAAEDNNTNQLVFTKLVKSCDIDLRFAGNGAEAVAAFEHDRPDLVFMDISMPGMDGKEATRRIREIEQAQGLPRTRIVALTAHGMDGDAEEILSHGLDAHLTKPFRKPAILAEIEAAQPDGTRPPRPAEA